MPLLVFCFHEELILTKKFEITSDNSTIQSVHKTEVYPTVMYFKIPCWT